MNTEPISAGSQPAPDTNVSTVNSESKKQATKHIKVFKKDHEKVMLNVEHLKKKFFEKAEAAGIVISNKGKGRDVVPSQPEAMEYFFGGYTSMDDYVDILVKRAQGVQ